MTLDDGDIVFFKIDEPKHCKPSTPIVAMFHGLGGCSESDYNRRIAIKLNQIGIRAARFNHRGSHPDDSNLARGIYHSGSFEDVLKSLQSLSQKWPDAPIFCIGFSISGTVLLNLLSKRDDIDKIVPNLQAAATICSPIDLDRCSKKIIRFQNFVYNRYFVSKLRRNIKKRSKYFPEFMQVKIPAHISLRTFDELLTAPFGGFNDRDHYYDSCSPKQLLHRIKTQTLMLAADDDPFVEAATYHDAVLGPQTTLRIERSGGHMGFFSSQKTRFGDNRWLDEFLIDWVLSQKN